MAMSMAIMKAMMVTVSAASFSSVGIVWVIGLSGKISWKMIKPAMMLPIARRFSGFKIIGLFSLAVTVGLIRGKLIEAKKTRRRL